MPFEHVAAQIRTARTLENRASAALKPYGISYSRFELLSLLRHSRSGALAMKEISSSLGLPAASVTHAVTALAEAGLVSRLANPSDGRGVLVSITDQGIALVSTVVPVLEKVFED
ncbi:MarR family transcriptional regulator [Corynebacterium sp. H130]|uniref:MarR family transcriptional regulator n=1 Tax=Corynebacterium sp. H130 TaxID=3133444 RepID=UPI0030986AE7